MKKVKNWNILYFDLVKLRKNDIIWGLLALQQQVRRAEFQAPDAIYTEEDLEKTLNEIGDAELVISQDFSAVVAEACHQKQRLYAAWVYDSPAVNLFSYTLINDCNYVFLFDSADYELFASQGIKTVFYLPLASAVARYDRIDMGNLEESRFMSAVSFVGRMYSAKANYYDQIEPKLSEYARGYLQGLMRAQMEIDGVNIIENALTKDVLYEMVDILGLEPNYDGVESLEYLYGNYVINRKITATERREIISMLGTKFPVNLFTDDTSLCFDGVTNKGKVDYYDEMPLVFKASDINLNITLRSIKKGIPLRNLDIMGCGGFLLTNYQEDMLRFFEPGVDFVYYESREDMLAKVQYYLEHENERRAIAQSGYEKVKAQHTYEHRLKAIIDTVTG